MEDLTRKSSGKVPLLSVVVPCFNEESVIRATHQRILDVLGSDPGLRLEIVYTNDGSHDHTEEILFELAEADERVVVVSFSRNFGHQPAVSAGLRHTSGDVAAIIDADLQDPPEVILEMLAKWREGYEVVYGVRTKRKESFLLRFAFAAFYRIFRRIANIDIPLDSGDFSLMDRRVVDVLNALPEKSRFLRGLRAWTGFRQTGVTYERAARKTGETKYSFRNRLKGALDGIADFSTAPLTLIFYTGLFTAIFSLFAFVFFLLHRLLGFQVLGHGPEEVPGFTSIILSVLFFSGVQLVSVGILGEYLGRVYQEVKERPSYVIRGVRGQRGTLAPPGREGERE